MPRIYSIDLLKFLSALAVAVLHLHWQYLPQGYLSVEIFFIISGFFIGLRYFQYSDKGIGTAILKRLRSFYLLYVMTFIITVFFFHAPSINEVISYLTFLSHVGLGVWYGHQSMWFLGVYLLSFTFVLALIKLIPKDKLLIVLWGGAFLLISVLYNSNEAHALNKTYELLIAFFPFSVYRGLLGLTVGTICGLYACRVEEVLTGHKTVCAFLLLVLICFLIFMIFQPVTAAFDFYIYPVTSLILLLLYTNNEIISQSVNCLAEKTRDLTSLSLEIYLFHPFIAFSYIKWPAMKPFLVQNPFVYLILVLILAFIMKCLAKLITKVLSNVHLQSSILK